MQTIITVSILCGYSLILVVTGIITAHRIKKENKVKQTKKEDKLVEMFTTRPLGL